MANNNSVTSNFDEVILTNDQFTGYAPRQEAFSFAWNSDVSAHGAANASGANVPMGPPFTMALGAPGGRIVDFGIFVNRPALSASGFVSGSITGSLRLNSVAICSTTPIINMVGTSAGAIPTLANVSAVSTAALTPTVLNTNSCSWSGSAFISFDYNTFSAGSAAAGAAGIGFRAFCVVQRFAK